MPRGGEATQFHVDDTHNQARGCHVGAEFEQQPRAVDRTLANAGRSTGSAQCLRERQQGIGGQRFNCKGDDGRVIPPRLRNALRCFRRIDPLRTLDERIRACNALRSCNADAYTVARKRGDAVLQRGRRRGIEA